MAPSPVVVLGAGGRTGAACVSRLEELGKEVRAVVRDPAKYASTLGGKKGVELVAGDVADVQSLRGTLQGASGVIFAASGTGYWSAKGVDYQGVANVADVLKEQGSSQPVVLVSSCLVSPHNRWHPIRIMLNNFRWSLMDYKYKGEEVLRKSGLPYTVVRPGGLVDEPAGQAQLVVAQGDKSSGRVARADVAAVAVAALNDPAARGLTLELTSKPAAEAAPAPLAQQLKSLFVGLKTDAA
ncbi:nad-dependent epimerase dehydratase isoform B [Chlorella sorokiniana]|uniref:Nad-dependent epimerase dehydratase isoform A n=1 Tax=Chlorella sorokiniana TaxID=3076 RepID=A0A2P6TYK2_CHLSO|nr:nad-dependent epimerase dehydratase isoform A [Chlorella sorokiniana]PRW59142.1 nad-dependent epimerase dehydratase isoform B [Chlorella sorokiniana]|eukprot:PRW59141.1 nad-dependent epimerase dehydratase isoform A [Chlorella sorokiniana]